MKKQIWFGIFGVVMVTLACTFGAGTPTTQPQVDEVGTAVAGTMQALTAAAPPTESLPTQPSGTPVSFENASFVIPIGLASGANSESIPAVGENDGAPWDVAPAHLEFTLTSYQLQDKFHQPKIYIYPAGEFQQVSPTVGEQIARVMNALRGAPLSKDTMPGIPFFNAGQVFAAQIQIIHFKNGSGVRLLTEYAQSFATINNRDLFYHFQGLTEDGKYYIIVILPVTAPMLASDEDPESSIPPDGVPFPGYDDPNADFNAYYAAITEKLNAAGADSFQPSLNQLDVLIQSILVTNP